jgi:hypothetical protein
MEDSRIPMTVKVPREVNQELRILAAKEFTSMQDIIMRAIRRELFLATAKADPEEVTLTGDSDTDMKLMMKARRAAMRKNRLILERCLTVC